MTTAVPVPAAEIESGRYCCVRTSSRVMGPLIRWSTRSPYDHAFLTGPRGMIVQATLTGVRYGHISEYEGALAVVNAAEPMTAAQRGKVWAKACSLVDAPYNYPDLLAIGLGDLGWHWKLAFGLCGADHAFICSQAVAVCGQAAGMNWMCRDPLADEVTPAALSRRPGVVPVYWGP